MTGLGARPICGDDLDFTPGLNDLIHLILVWERVNMEMIHRSPGETLRNGTGQVQAILDQLKPELRWTGGLAWFPKPLWCHEVQTVNILITSLSLKSNLLQHLVLTNTLHSFLRHR